MKKVIKFVSADGSQVLTVAAATGKRGVVNVKATVKNAKDENGKAPRALTGMRGSYLTDEEAQEKLDLIEKEIVTKGWTSLQVRSKNAFSEIPMAPGFVPVVEEPKAAEKSKGGRK